MLGSGTDRWTFETMFAVFAVVILVLSAMTAPVAAGWGHTDAAEADGGLSQAATVGSADATQSSGLTLEPIIGPQMTFAEARNEIASISASTRGRQSHLDRATREFDGVVSSFDSPVDAELSSLLDAAQGTRALRAFVVSGNRDISDEQRASVRRSSRLAVEATNTTARLQLQAARWRLAAHEDDLSKGQRRSLQASIENAERAYERAERVRDRIAADDRLQRTLNQRARAITQYRVGWQQASQVLDRLDEPTNRSDTDGDGVSDTREQRLGTNVSQADTDFDGIGDGTETADGYPLDTDGDGTIDALDADSDGDALADYVEGTNDTDGDAIADFRDADDDGDTIPTRTEIADAVAPGGDRDFDGTPNWYDTDSDGDAIQDAVEGRVDEDGDGDPAYLDADLDEDGLVDSYERNVTGTDPRDNDSDAPRTSVNEADNGVIDGLEDFDNDTLTTFREYTIDTDPFVADTDGDGLDDGLELQLEAYDPTVADSDDDGVLDGAEDADNDTLDNSREAELGTSLVRNDTDGDSLLDHREVAAGTDPLSVDTDSDGLPDAEERQLPTDPIDRDTDDDGVLDGNETFETVRTNESTGVSVVARGNGNVASGVEITPKSDYFQGSNLSAGPTVHLTSEHTFANATVKIPIDQSIPASQYDDLAVFKWNGTAKDRWHRIDTTIENGTATATVDSFSYFAVLDTDEWVSATTGSAPSGGTSTDLISFDAETTFSCSHACDLSNDSTLVLGGEPSARQITLEQNDRRITVVPLSNGQSSVDFYNYGNKKIRSSLPVTASDKSRLMFWSGPEGISLMVVHDKGNDGSGGAMDLAFDGLPTDVGKWVVIDGPGDFDSDTDTHVTWDWAASKTDGGVFRGGLTNRTITITPAFNDAATGSPIDPGSIDGWQVLTGRATEPVNHSLNMSEPVTVHIPAAPATNDTNVSGDTGAASFEYDVPSDARNLSIVYQTEQTDVEPNATVTITGPSGASVSESLNIGTVGTVEERIDLAQFAGEQVSVSIDADGVNLRTQLVVRSGSTGSSLDSDGDGIPNALEERTWAMTAGPGGTFSTDPNDADTDDDGLPDGEEVTFASSGSQRGTVTPYVTSNPVVYDTDGDGLSDRREIEGTTTTIAEDPESARAYRKAVRNEESNPERHLQPIDVSSSPLRTNSDGDNLSDTKETALGLSPSMVDTDGDTLADDTEVNNQWYARLHDFRPPRITGHVESDGDREEYRFEFTVQDQSQIGSVKVFKGGKQRNSKTDFTDSRESAQLEWTIDRGVVGKFWEGVSGYIEPASARALATDIHGNEGPKKRYLGPNNFGKIAKGFGEASIPFISEAGVVTFSAVSGLAQGVNVFKNDIITLGFVIGSPDRWGPAYHKAKRGIEQLGLMVVSSERRQKGLAAIVKHYGDRRRQLNPFEEGDRLHGTFAIGYSVGYGSSFLIPAYGEYKAGQLAVRLPYIAALVRSVNTMQRTIKGVTVGSALWTGGKIARRMPDVEFRVARRVSDVEVGQGAGQLISKTGDTLRSTPLPRQQRILELTEGTTDGDVMDWLTRNVRDPDSDRYQRGLVYLRRTGAQGKELLSRLRPDARSALLRLKEKAVLQRQLTQAWRRGDIDALDIGRATRRYDELDAGKRAEFEDLVDRTGPDGVEFLGQVDDASFRAFMDSDVDARLQANSIRRYVDLDDDAREIFGSIVRDPDIRDSWIRAVGSGNTDSLATSKALSRVNELRNQHSIREFHTAAKANARYVREKTDDGYEDPQGPHRDGGIVVEYETDDTQTLYRLWDESEDTSNMLGEFTTTEDVIKSANSYEELTEKLAAPSGFEYDRIARVDVPEGTRIAMSTTGKNFGRKGGVTQTRLLGNVNIDHWTPLDSLKDV